MTEPTEKVESIDAREASKSRVVTHESLMASLAGPASEDPPKDEPKGEDKPKEGEQKPAKKSPQERIVELAHKRKEAEAKADAEKQRADALEIKLKALEAKAAPIEQKPRPIRESFVSQEAYEDAIGDWKADQRIAERERQQTEAQLKAEFDELLETWDTRQKKVIESIPDYAETMANAEVQVRDYIHTALLESEKGPEIAYYLALHPEEAKRLNAMKPLAAIKRIASLESDLAEPDDDAPPQKATALPTKSKAPEPINPVKSTGASNPGKAESFEEYRKRRQASKGR